MSCLKPSHFLNLSALLLWLNLSNRHWYFIAKINWSKLEAVHQARSQRICQPLHVGKIQVLPVDSWCRACVPWRESHMTKRHYVWEWECAAFSIVAKFCPCLCLKGFLCWAVTEWCFPVQSAANLHMTTRTHYHMIMILCTTLSSSI